MSRCHCYSKRIKAESGSSSDQNHKIYFTDVLTFEYLNEAQLLGVHLERYSGILVTSTRSAIAVSNAVNKLELELKQQVFKKLQSMPVFSVGAATSRELLHLGAICKGDDAGSADMLSEICIIMVDWQRIAKRSL
ncbi:hypothetical protein PsorP6_013576 [Peronosclerospora sorghi]|uniref:Uncharacterized protein n=1 Tax=Peronosclerospora sorghi TaxID=230839 RepID=A0ACC0VHI6_9STRA|nr:hypothetical protein PsorP6_013576 [Peronosclerospora sorghi]